MVVRSAFLWIGVTILCFADGLAQCPDILTSDAIGHDMTLCEGSMLTMVATGENLPIGSHLDWYLIEGNEDPYDGDGVLLGSALVTGDPCSNPPEILYIMVNPDNVQVGGTGDQCDEFIVMWTGSGGYSTSDILVSNLGPGSFVWDDFIPGNAANFSCGVALPPGPVPADAILIIQSSTANNVFIDSDDLCASGLPVYIISYSGTITCAGGYFDNNTPCSSCPVMVEIDGNPCMFDFDLNYNPPAASIDGWGWANTGSGVYGDVIPALDIPVFDMSSILIADFVWTVPANFCETYTGTDYAVIGIPDPPPMAPCTEESTGTFDITVGCGSINLTGGGDVCEGNCPEAPTEMIFTISGNDAPYTIDIVVTATLFGSFPINDLVVSDGEVIYVCLEGFFPSFDPSTGILNIPTLAIGFMASVEITGATTASGCPVNIDQNIVSLHFIAAPTASTGNDQTICAGETVSVSGSIGGSAVTSMWETSGDGDFANPNNLATVYTPGPGDIADGEVTLTLFSSDPNGSCIPGESSLTVTINPSLYIEVITPLAICDNDIAFITAMVTGSSEVCMWETSGDGVFDDADAESTVYTPGVLDIANGMVTLMFVPVNPNACVEFNEPIELTFLPAPEVMVPQNLEVCEGDDIEIEIDVSGDYTSIMWSTNGDGVLIVQSDFMVMYTPGPIDISNQFFIISVIIQSAYPECGQITYNLPVNVAFCDCPDFETVPPTAPLCAVSGTLDLSGLLLSGGAGSWSITNTPPGSDPAILVGNIFTTNNSDPGIYTVTYTQNSPDPGCPATTSEQISVTSVLVPFAGQDMAFCGYQNVAMTGQVTPSSPATILWESSGDGSFSDPNTLNTFYMPGPLDSMSAGLYLVLHVLDPICGDQRDSVTLFFNTPPATLFVNDTASICNTSANGSVLNFFSLITGGDASGVWTNPMNVPVDFSNPMAVDFNGIAEGYYAFQYETNSAVSPCSETTYMIIIHVEECTCPLLVIQNVPGGVCNTLPALPLDPFVQAGAPGSWSVVTTPPGSNPGTITGSTFIINGCDQGTYRLRFTFDAAPIDACPDSAELDLFVQDVPLVSASMDITSCGSVQLSLSGMIGGSSSGIAWTANGSGSFNNPSSLNPMYTPSSNDVMTGMIQLVATSIDTFGFCVAPKDTIEVTLLTPPFALFSALVDTVCNNSDSGSVVNLSSFIFQGDQNGIWTDMDGSLVDLSDPTQVDFDGIAQGNYRFVYTTQSAVSPCVDSMYTFVVVVKDCSCPPFDILTDDLFLCQGATLDLDALILNAAAGAWYIFTGPAGIWPVITGSNLSTTNAAGGAYSLQYTLTDSIPGCRASEVLLLQIEAPVSFVINDISCDSDQVIYEVVIETNASSLTSDFGMVSLLAPGAYTIDSIPVGQDIQVEALGASGLCIWTFDIAAPDCNCTLTIEDIADTIRFCPGDTFVLIPIVTGAQGLPFATWVTPYGTFMQPTLPLYREGTYIWIVRDMAGCEERDTFEARFMGPESAMVTTIPPSCPDDTDGQIVVLSVEEGSPPYMAQLDGGAPVLLDQFPYVFTGVGLGDHDLLISDMIGCTLSMVVTLDNQSFGSISLGPDITIPEGDSVFIQPISNGVEVASVTWSPGLPGQAFESFWLRPDSSMTLTAFVVDNAGCMYEDQMRISIFSEETFFIPNIFSPNGDQINDVFEIVTNLPEDQIVSLSIYDRWGGLMYSQTGDLPLRWDGTMKDEQTQSGVYVYRFVWLDERGNTKIKIGDITLIR